MLPWMFTGLLDMKVHLMGRTELTAIQHPGIHSKDPYIQENFWSVLHCISKLLKSSLYQHRNVSLPTDSCSNGEFGRSTSQKCNMDNRQASHAATAAFKSSRGKKKKTNKLNFFLSVLIFFLKEP